MWPSANLPAWLDTCWTLHRQAQMVGKVRLALTPLENHWWNVPLYVSARGLTTSAMWKGPFTFELEFDFLRHALELRRSDGLGLEMPLEQPSIAAFYRAFLEMLKRAELGVKLWPVPVEVPEPVPFTNDKAPAVYDRGAAGALWGILRDSSRVFHRFRAEFEGKASPVHFFWGSFDLAVSRYSGRRAPERPGADAITREAYSHEVSSVGFWPGSRGGLVREACYYAYAVPEPEGYRRAAVQPEAARYSPELGEYLLDYEAVRSSTDPEAALLAFCRTTYAAQAELARWDRAALERIAA